MMKSDLRIVLLGITGAGKSATGNTILGKEVFKAELSFESVTTTCQVERSEVAGRLIILVDSLGLLDTETNEHELKREIKRCVELSWPHAFLLVIRLDVRFTEEEKSAVKWIQENFGEESLKYTIVLLTHGDALKGKPVNNFLIENAALSSLIRQCGGRFHTFNNMSTDRTQVSELLEKIEAMVEENGGGHYTSEMYKNAQMKIQKRKLQNTIHVCALVGTAVAGMATLKLAGRAAFESAGMAALKAAGKATFEVTGSDFEAAGKAALEAAGIAALEAIGAAGFKAAVRAVIEAAGSDIEAAGRAALQAAGTAALQAAEPAALKAVGRAALEAAIQAAGMADAGTSALLQ